MLNRTSDWSLKRPVRHGYALPHFASRQFGPLWTPMFKPLAWLWALPWTAVGVGIGVATLPYGGKVQRRRGVVEFYGRPVARLLTLAPNGSCVIAMTLGHSILGATAAALDIARDHEHVHVRQYERWGPFFVPAYYACSAYIWLRGGCAYRDNPFEREAYSACP